MVWKQENEKVKNTPMEIKLKNEIIKQLQVNDGVKKLGACVNSGLNWNDEFDYKKNKITLSIKKLMRTDMKTQQAHVCFNAHTLTNVCVFLVLHSAV